MKIKRIEAIKDIAKFVLMKCSLNKSLGVSEVSQMKITKKIKTSPL